MDGTIARVRRAVGTNRRRDREGVVRLRRRGLPRQSSLVFDASDGGRDGRAVDGGGLENHCTGNGTGGSNPSPSATLASLVCRGRGSLGPVSYTHLTLADERSSVDLGGRR